MVDVLVKALEPDVIDAAVRSAVKALQADAEAHKGRRQTVTAELATIATHERRLLDLLVDGDGDASALALSGRLREELARRDDLTAGAGAAGRHPDFRRRYDRTRRAGAGWEHSGGYWPGTSRRRDRW